MTYLAPSSHRKLNEKRALDMSSLFYLEPLFLDVEYICPNSPVKWLGRGHGNSLYKG